MGDGVVHREDRVGGAPAAVAPEELQGHELHAPPRDTGDADAYNYEEFTRLARD